MMTVNEMIAQLQTLAAAGYGESAVRTSDHVYEDEAQGESTAVFHHVHGFSAVSLVDDAVVLAVEAY